LKSMGEGTVVFGTLAAPMVTLWMCIRFKIKAR